MLPDSQPSETEMINVRGPELLSLRQFVIQSPIAHLYSWKDEMLWPELGHLGWGWGVWMEQTGGPGQGLGRGGGGEALCGQNTFAGWARVEPSPGTSTLGVTASNTLPPTVTPGSAGPVHLQRAEFSPEQLQAVSHHAGGAVHTEPQGPAFVLLQVIGRGHALRRAAERRAGPLSPLLEQHHHQNCTAAQNPAGHLATGSIFRLHGPKVFKEPVRRSRDRYTHRKC